MPASNNGKVDYLFGGDKDLFSFHVSWERSCMARPGEPRDEASCVLVWYSVPLC